MISGLTLDDPYTLNEYFPNSAASLPNGGYYNLFNKTPVTLDRNQNNAVLITFGDSLGVNVAPTPYTPTHSNVLNYCIYNGATYSAVDPVLGCSLGGGVLGTGNMFTRLADKVQGTGKYTNTVLVPAGVGGTIGTQWAVDQFSRIHSTFNRLSAAGVIPIAVLIQLGANDSANGTTQISYTASMNSMIALIRLYFTGRIFVATESWYGGVTSAGIQAAQAAVVSGLVMAGPNTDSLNATYRQADNTHWNDAGADACATLWLNSLTPWI